MASLTAQFGATFIGYVIAGIPGAVVATVGIFLPLFIWVVALNPLIPYLQRSKWSSAFLNVVNASALALMIGITLQLAISTLEKSTTPCVDVWAVMIAIASAILAVRFRINAVWLVL